MKVFIRGIVIATFVTVATAGSAATLFPFLTPVRTEIFVQLAALTNGSTAGTAQDVRLLTQARNAIDRTRGRATLSSDLQLLANLANLLYRTSDRTLFDPALDQAIMDYRDTLVDAAIVVETNLNAMPTSGRTDSAFRTLALLNDSLAMVDSAPDAIEATRLLSRSAVRLVALQSFVNRMTQVVIGAGNGAGSGGGGGAPIGRQELRAFVGPDTFEVGPTTSATLNPALGFLTIGGTQVVGTGTRSLSITFSDVFQGTTTHSLGSTASGNYAIYTSRGTNVVGYTSSSGNATVTLDTNANTVTGTFSFVGVNSFGIAAPVQVSGGTFSARLR